MEKSYFGLKVFEVQSGVPVISDIFGAIVHFVLSGLFKFIKKHV